MTFLESVNKALGWFFQGSRDKDLEMGRGHWTVCPVHCHIDPERHRPKVRCTQEGDHGAQTDGRATDHECQWPPEAKDAERSPHRWRTLSYHGLPTPGFGHSLRSERHLHFVNVDAQGQRHVVITWGPWCSSTRGSGC